MAEVDVTSPKNRSPLFMHFLLAVSVFVVLTVMVVVKLRGGQEPQFSAADALAIRDAQVDVLRLSAQLDAISKQFQAKQAVLDAAIAKGMKDAGADQKLYTVSEQDGHIVIVKLPGQPKAEPASKK